MKPLKILLFVAFWLLSHAAAAHQSSTAYLTGTLSDTGLIEGEWQVRLYDLERAIGIDADHNGTLLWGELLARKAEVARYLHQHLTIARGATTCPWRIDDLWQISEHFNEGYLVLLIRTQCAIAGELTFAYSAFFEQDSDHKMLVALTEHLKNAELENRAQPLTISRILSDDQRRISLQSTGGSVWRTAQEFIMQGAIHIWKGTDHVLFLFSLLLTCVLLRANERWVGNSRKREIVMTTTWIVTAFTLAHSLTLTATAFNWLHFSSRWVEVGIAASVILAALNNIYPLVVRLGWMTFAFGLLHGMGFAGVLGELGVPADQKLLTVLSFNLGVELGQLAIVAGVLPLLILIRNRRWYSRYAVPLASIAIALLASRWLYERV